MASRKQLYRQRTREEIRADIPLRALLKEKLNVALRGKLATYDEDGKVTGFVDVDVKDRLGALDGLVGYALPKNPAEAAEMLEDDSVDAKEIEAVEHNPELLSSLSEAELYRIANGVVEDHEQC